MSTIDAIKMRKVEQILSGLTRDEQRHCASFLSTALGITAAPAPVAPAPAPAINSIADARQAIREMEHRQMRQFKRGDLVKFQSKRGFEVQGRIEKFNDRTVGLDNGYRVSPQMLSLVNPRPSAATPAPAPARPTAAIPSAPGSGSW